MIPLIINDYDGNELSLTDRVQMVNEEGVPFDNETSAVRLKETEEGWNVVAFEREYVCTPLGERFGNYFKIVSSTKPEVSDSFNNISNSTIVL